jgi:hypothetical protein
VWGFLNTGVDKDIFVFFDALTGGMETECGVIWVWVDVFGNFFLQTRKLIIFKAFIKTYLILQSLLYLKSS